MGIGHILFLLSHCQNELLFQLQSKTQCQLNVLKAGQVRKLKDGNNGSIKKTVDWDVMHRVDVVTVRVDRNQNVWDELSWKKPKTIEMCVRLVACPETHWTSNICESPSITECVCLECLYSWVMACICLKAWWTCSWTNLKLLPLQILHQTLQFILKLVRKEPFY